MKEIEIKTSCYSCDERGYEKNIHYCKIEKAAIQDPNRVPVWCPRKVRDHEKKAKC